MRKDHVFMLDTLRALTVFFENYGDVVEKSPLLKEDVADYNGIVEDIEAKVDPDNAPITISTATKTNLRNKVTQSLTNGLAKINAQAIKTGDEDLEKKSGTTVTAFTRCSDSDFVDLAKEKIKLLLANTAILEKYNLKAAYRTELENDIDILEKIKAKMSVERSKSTVATSSINDLFAKAKRYVEVVLPQSVSTVAKSNLDFAKEFAHVCSMRTAVTSATRITVLVINDKTDEAVVNADIEVLEVNSNTFTDQNGKSVVKTGAKKTVTIRVTKEGMVTQEYVVEKILRGQNLEVTIRLVAAA